MTRWLSGSVLAAEPDSQGLTPETHMVEGNSRLPQVVLLTFTHEPLHAQPLSPTQYM